MNQAELQEAIDRTENEVFYPNERIILKAAQEYADLLENQPRCGCSIPNYWGCPGFQTWHEKMEEETRGTAHIGNNATT